MSQFQKNVIESRGLSGVAFENAGKSFCEDATGASLVVAEKLAGVYEELHWPKRPWQVPRLSLVTTVNPGTEEAAVWAWYGNSNWFQVKPNLVWMQANHA